VIVNTEGVAIMATQDRINTGGSSTETEEEIPEPAPAAPAAQDSTQTQGVDDLLDEIDGVLESNAEEFVRGFVQKGGQ
jgi:ubiquitin-like protein Pup